MSRMTPEHAGSGHGGPGHGGPGAGGLDPAVLAPFAGLVAELGELGFEPSPVQVEPGRVVYTATDSPVTITLLTDPGSAHVRSESPADGQPWYVVWTEGTALHVQLIVLYAVLNHDPMAALSAAAASLATTPDEPTRRLPQDWACTAAVEPLWPDPLTSRCGP